MICGPGFPLPNPESIVGNQRFCNVLGTPEILQNILSNLCYTDRASLSQSCRLAAVGVSNFQALWSINAEDLGDAEFQHEEFEHLIQAGEMWDVSAPRGAKVSISPPDHEQIGTFRNRLTSDGTNAFLLGPDGHDDCLRVSSFQRL